MPDGFLKLSPVLQALLAGCFTYALTAAGASLVFLTREMNRKLLDAMLGFSGGVMLAASYFSLLAPAVEAAEGGPLPSWIPATGGFVLGGAALLALDRVIPHLHLFGGTGEEEGPRSHWHRSLLLVMAITLHNIPEGLAVGVGFGGAASGLPGASIAAAVTLAVGIGLQNFPEGSAVSMPLRGEGMSRGKAFFYGQASGVVEPLAAVLGGWAVTSIRPILPWSLAFAAGAMVYVVVEELVPESQRGGNADLATTSLIGGFALMMALDIALG